MNKNRYNPLSKEIQEKHAEELKKLWKRLEQLKNALKALKNKTEKQ